MLDFPLCDTRIHGNLNSGFKKREEGTESAGRPRARTERWGRAYKMKSVWRDAAEN